MPDVENVIKGLKYLHDVKRWSPNESEESITARRNITGDALALLKAQAQAPVVHGRWTEKETSENTIDEWQSAKCTNCGKYHTTPYLYYFSDYKFCPNCGAKMDGERRDDDADDRR